MTLCHVFFFVWGFLSCLLNPAFRWDGPESPSTPRLVAASTDPHNAALCVAMDAHLAVVRSAFRRCELGCVQPDGGCGIDDHQKLPRYLKMEVKTPGSSVCIHITVYIRIYNILYIYAVSKRSPNDPWTWSMKRRRQHLDLTAVKLKGWCFNRHFSFILSLPGTLKSEVWAKSFE